MGKEHPISELWRTRMREIGLRRRLRNRETKGNLGGCSDIDAKEMNTSLHWHKLTMSRAQRVQVQELKNMHGV